MKRGLCIANFESWPMIKATHRGIHYRVCIYLSGEVDFIFRPCADSDVLCEDASLQSMHSRFQRAPSLAVTRSLTRLLNENYALVH